MLDFKFYDDNMRLKNIFMFSMAIGTLSLQSCSDFLDTKPTDIVSEEMVWGDKNGVEAYIVQTMSNMIDLYQDFQTMDKAFTNNVVACRSVCSDEARGLRTREWDWGFGYFSDIRACNLLIEKAATATGITDDYRKQAIAEGKMMRAMIYFYQARHCGRFIWVDHVLSEDDEFNLPLTADMKESYTYILQDIDEAIEGLPEQAEAGRFTKNAARTLKSEVCLTAAAYVGADEFEGGNLYQQAIDAVNAIQGASLDADYGSIFNEQGAYTSPEIILGHYYSKDNTTCSSVMLINMQPNVPNSKMDMVGYGPHWNTDMVFEGWLEFTPTQNLVDAYLVIDQADGQAKAWNETSQFKNATREISLNEASSLIPPQDPKELVEGQSLAYKTLNGEDIASLMYENRDKRFDASILHDGSVYYDETLIMRQKGNMNRQCTRNYGNDHVPLSNYAWRKCMYNISPRIYYNIYTDYHYVIFRYGRALLNKAEALLCLAKNDASKLPEAVSTFNQTRTVHGGLPASDASTLEEAWEDYKRERRVEFVLEDDFYWSLLRWGKYGYEANDGEQPGGMIAELNKPATFPEISSDGTSVYIGNIQFLNDQRVFRPERGYLFPIPQSVINANSAIDESNQNPGW